MQTALNDARLTPQDLNKIILVGGSSRILAVQEKVKEIIKKANLKETSLSTLAKTIDIANTNDFVQFFIDLER